jgi:hypothetical protein
MKEYPLSLKDLEIHAAGAEMVTWQGREALRLENGLVLAPRGPMRDLSMEVLIGTEGAAYPGVAFRVADVSNYELAYAVPHVSGQWDALQYDPVFHGSNTWQLYHGPGYQREAEVPTGRWFRLKLDCCGSRAIASVNGQPPLEVGQLAHPTAAGRFGLWTFQPAYFSDLQVSACEQLALTRAAEPTRETGAVGSWFVEGHGVVACEPHGPLNLNRYFSPSMEKARLVRRFETSRDGEVTFEFGYSDTLMLQLDGQAVYSGENRFGGFADRAARGYVEPGMASVRQALAAGSHTLVAELAVSEGFGWGIVLAARGEGLRWLPAELG